MKQVWMAEDGSIFNTQEECAGYEKISSWTALFSDRIGLNKYVSYGGQLFDSKVEQGEYPIGSNVVGRIANSDEPLEFFYSNRFDIYKLADVIKEVTQEIYGSN